MAATFKKLSRPQLRALQPGQKITENGISFERLANGDGVYSVNIMVDRQRIHRVIGRESDGTTRTQCDMFIEQSRTQAREGRLSLPQGRKVALTFAEAGKAYIAKLREEGGKCIERKERQLDLHLTPFFGSKVLSQLKQFDMERYKKARREAGASGGTVNRELAVVSHMFTKAVDWGWITHKPARIERNPESNGRKVYLTVEQVARVLAAAEQDISPHVYAFCRIALSTSMRMSEVLTLRRENVDFDRRRLFIPQAKAGAREQPISADLATFLKKHVAQLQPGTPWLFPSIASRSGRLATIRKAHRRVVKAAGLDPDQVVRHTFRHTAITHAVQAGIDLATVQKISGHKTLTMVMQYSHSNGTHIDAAMDKLQEQMAPTSAKVVQLRSA